MTETLIPRLSVSHIFLIFKYCHLYAYFMHYAHDACMQLVTVHENKFDYQTYTAIALAD